MDGGHDLSDDPNPPTTTTTTEPPTATRRRTLPAWLKGNLLLLPTTVWLVVLMIIPMFVVISYSVGIRGISPPVRVDWGDLRWSNYQRALDTRFLPVFMRSIWYASACTFFCVLLGFPLAYWIARFSGKFRNLFLVLVIIPFLTSYLIRMYAWQFILQRNGLLNDLLGSLGLGDNHAFLNTHFAVILGLAYGFLPFMILPLYVSIERMDPSLVEASYDLGHGKTSTFFRVTLPTVQPGLVAGILLVFIPAVGDFVTQQLLGGTKTNVFGNVIQDFFLGGGQNWPLGAAMAVLLMAFILVGVFVYLWRVGEEGAI